MKLQIMARLNRFPHQQRPLHALPCPTEPTPTIPYHSNPAPNPNPPPHSSPIPNQRDFFNNFDLHCHLSYKHAPFHTVGVHRRLQPTLSTLACNSQNESPIRKRVLAICSKQESAATLPQQSYYLARAKPKLNKFQSEGELRVADATSVGKRKPGFILKKNLSLGKENDAYEREISQSQERIAQMRRELVKLEGERRSSQMKLRLR